MTPVQLIELRDYIAADPTLLAMAQAGQDNNIVEELCSRTQVILQKPHQIGQRGICSSVGLIAGHKFLKDLKAFSEELLPAEDPLIPFQEPIGSLIAWLYMEGGLDIGDSETRTNLDGLVSAGKLDATVTSTIKSLAEQTVSVAIAKGWHGVSHLDVARAVRDGSGNLLIGA
ncbi:MAG TPA: hypothetical protein VFS89_00985 [Nitrosospira sp.]|nr:hypothetical protein [Nitrosospira sp.]